MKIERLYVFLERSKSVLLLVKKSVRNWSKLYSTILLLFKDKKHSLIPAILCLQRKCFENARCYIVSNSCGHLSFIILWYIYLGGPKFCKACWNLLHLISVLDTLYMRLKGTFLIFNDQKCAHRFPIIQGSI